MINNAHHRGCPFKTIRTYRIILITGQLWKAEAFWKNYLWNAQWSKIILHGKSLSRSARAPEEELIRSAESMLVLCSVLFTLQTHCSDDLINDQCPRASWKNYHPVQREVSQHSWNASRPSSEAIPLKVHWAVLQYSILTHIQPRKHRVGSKHTGIKNKWSRW